MRSSLAAISSFFAQDQCSRCPRVKPPALPSNARIAIISPAGKVGAEQVEIGCTHLKLLGYTPVLFPATLAQGPLEFAGGISARVADFHAAFADPGIDAVFCTRGGWGSAELLPYLDTDLVRRNPKPFIGYSDITTIHLWLTQRCRVVSFHAPMIAADFGHDRSLLSIHLRSFHSALTGQAPWSLGAEEGLRLLRRSRNDLTTAQGLLVGGCLSILVASLGTPWAMKASRVPQVLFLEDINTPHRQWLRMILQLQQAGLFNCVTGVVIGDTENCLSASDPAERDREREYLEACILHALEPFDGVIAIGLKSGHVEMSNITLPLGAEVRLEVAGELTMRILENAVQERLDEENVMLSAR